MSWDEGRERAELLAASCLLLLLLLPRGGVLPAVLELRLQQEGRGGQGSHAWTSQ